MSAVPVAPPRRLVDLEIDGEAVRVPDGSTILDACRAMGVDTPTLCFADNLTPVNACRVCVVEVEGSRTLVPACSRKAEPGMKVKTGTERVGLSRRLVLEFLASSVDTGLTGPDVGRWMSEYGARYVLQGGSDGFGFVCWRRSRLNRNSSSKRFGFPRITPSAPGASPQAPGALLFHCAEFEECRTSPANSTGRESSS
jgi:ferredoxin